MRTPRKVILLAREGRIIRVNGDINKFKIRDSKFAKGTYIANERKETPPLLATPSI
jgi:hypothetical protein